MINILFSNPLAFLIIFPGLLIAITIHEFAHSWMADRLGDPTPRIKGRLTLDPRAHLDPIGTIAILLTRFGWGKPAPFDPYNLKEPIRDTALIALAGPLSNLTLALLLAILIRFNLLPFVWLNVAAFQLIFINVVLSIFNLLPVYPLDGSKIILAFLPPQVAAEYQRFMQRFGLIILLLLIFPLFGGTSPVAQLIIPIINFIIGLLLGT